ncbi:MAG: electron transfer flavoprotein subunit beta/FixA family protein [Peptococcaceae bacterium]|nr:electron transfer flavoprotein subunit beta/FixA family protein [Peptococcaceae bacterium]
MNIVVVIKQTFDTEAKIVLKDGQIDPSGVSLVINPYDEFAIEEALRIQKKFGGEVTVVSCGGPRSQEAIRTALAMGCDKGVQIDETALESVDEYVRAEVLAKAISEMPYDIILGGRIAVDDRSSQVAVRLAEALNIPSVSSVVKLDIENNIATATREIDGGTEIIEVPLPAMITAQKGLNEPRYPTMPGIMKARKKELKVINPADLGVSDLSAKMKVQNYSLPTPRQGGKKIEGEPAEAARELARLLREEAKVL